VRDVTKRRAGDSGFIAQRADRILGGFLGVTWRRDMLKGNIIRKPGGKAYVEFGYPRYRLVAVHVVVGKRILAPILYLLYQDCLRHTGYLPGMIAPLCATCTLKHIDWISMLSLFAVAS
jgi:hypothetical protein